MASDFSDQTLAPAALEQLMSTLSLARRGDLSVRMPLRGDGVTRDVAEDINGILENQQQVNAELARVVAAFTRGELTERASVQGCEGDWDQPVHHLNAIAGMYARHCAELRRVAKAATAGDFSRQMAVGEGSNHQGGDAQRTAEEVNGLVTYLNLVVNEVMQVVAAVGLDGRLASKVQLAETSGSWGLLVGSLNAMTATLSEQVLDLTETAHAYSRGNLDARASVVSRGDMQALKDALNRTGERTRDLCTELIRVGDEWVQEGRTGGQVRLGEAVGDMRQAVEAVNAMLERVGTQLEDLAGLADHLANDTAIDLSKSPDARGIFAKTREHLLLAVEHSRRLRESIDGLTTNRFPTIESGQTDADMSLFRLGVRLKREWFGAARSGLLDARRVAESLTDYCHLALARTAAAVDAELGALYTVEDGEVRMLASLGNDVKPEQVPPMKLGEGIIGKVAATGEAVCLTELGDHNLRARTGLLEVTPSAVMVFPVMYEAESVGVLELGFVRPNSQATHEMLDFLSQDLVEGLLEAMQYAEGRHASRNASLPDERLREVSEDLAIASARIERLTRELHNRDLTIRNLQQELDLLRDSGDDSVPQAG